MAAFLLAKHINAEKKAKSSKIQIFAPTCDAYRTFPPVIRATSHGSPLRGRRSHAAARRGTQRRGTPRNGAVHLLSFARKLCEML
jgi:hypothetical protein